MKRNSTISKIVTAVLVIILVFLSILFATWAVREPEIEYYYEQVYVRNIDDANAQYYAFKKVVDYKNSTEPSTIIRFTFIVSMENPNLLETLVKRNTHYKSEINMTYFNWDTGELNSASVEKNCWVLIMER